MGKTFIFLVIISLGSLIAYSHKEVIKIHKSPYCGCCNRWVSALKDEGYKLEIVNTNKLLEVKQEAGIDTKLSSCHTAFVNGYVLEGHVHPQSIEKLLIQKPSLKGLAVPGMPASSVGMDIGNDPYKVLAITRDGEVNIYQSFND